MKEIVDRIFPTAPEHEVEAAGERVLNRLREELAKHDTSVRSLYGDGWNAEPVTQREFQILTAIAMLGGAGTGLGIQDKIESWGVPANLGAVYVVLERLEIRGLVKGEELPDPVKKELRRHYLLTNAGERAGPGQGRRKAVGEA